MKHFFVAGFDFGTSYSKVVLRDQFSGVAKVVTFGREASGLLPSFLRVADSEIAGPGGFETDGLLVTYPKLIAADAASGDQNFVSLYGEKLDDLCSLLRVQDLERAARILLTRYFLSVLDAIHDFIASDDEWNGFAPDEDPLVVQLAVPTGLMSDRDNSLDKLMQEALATATILRTRSGCSTSSSSVQEITVGWDTLQSLDRESRVDLDSRCITYPEVAAGVQTVLRSRNTPDGKYITIDIGAGTVDINAFLRRSVTDHGEDCGLDYWACQVVPLGFARLDIPDQGHGRRLDHETIVNPLAEHELFKQLGIAIGGVMQNAFRFQPFSVAGDGPSPWKRGTYAYAWGGGSGYSPYLDKFLQSLKGLQIGVNTINLLPAPGDHFVMPDDLAGNFGRLAVAYGLSYHQANLEAVRLPHQLKSFEELHPSCWKYVSGPLGSLSNGRPLDSSTGALIPNFIPTTDLRSLSLGVSNRNTAPARPPRPPSRYEIALTEILNAYITKGEKMLVADRVRELNQIWNLCKRPEVNNNKNLVESAIAVVNAAPQSMVSHSYEAPVRGPTRKPLRGYVQVLRGSAQSTAYGCTVVVKLRGRHEHEEMEIYNGRSRLVTSINQSLAHPRVEVLCTIGRIDRFGSFSLVALRDFASPPRPPAKKPSPSTTERKPPTTQSPPC
jgi:hypothetical protein